VPVRAGAQNPEYPVDEIEVIDPLTAGVSDLAGQNARDPLPLVRRQFVAFWLRHLQAPDQRIWCLMNHTSRQN
jgi:hypothetical protein